MIKCFHIIPVVRKQFSGTEEQECTYFKWRRCMHTIYIADILEKKHSFYDFLLVYTCCVCTLCMKKDEEQIQSITLLYIVSPGLLWNHIFYSPINGSTYCDMTTGSDWLIKQMRPLLSNGAVNTCPRYGINTQQWRNRWMWCFLCSPCRGYTARTTGRS
jgi:hypothetical protein